MAKDTDVFDTNYSMSDNIWSVENPQSVTARRIPDPDIFDTDSLMPAKEQTETWHMPDFLHSQNIVIPEYETLNTVTETYIYDPDTPVPKYVRHVVIPEGVTVINEYAFSDCHDLQSVTIPDGVTKIGNYAFSGCSGLQSITIPDSVTEIGEGAFSGCSGLQSVTIPDSVTKIGRGSFEHCSGLQSVTIPDSVTEIGGGTFHGCRSLQSVIIPDGVTKIGNWAFYGCSGLQSITIPDGVTEIRLFVFEKCTGLQSVTIPDSVTEIKGYAFDGCPALQSLMYKGVNIAPVININGYGVNTFHIIKTLVYHGIPLNENTVKIGIDMEHQCKLSQWMQEYPVFGTMHLSADMKSPDGITKEQLQKCFAGQKKTKHRIPRILDELAITVRACGIPPERLAGTFDIEYTKNLLSEKIPIVPATACRCYYDRNTCDMLIRKDKIAVMAEAISLYNRSGCRECYKYLMDFILSHPDTKSEDLRYAVDHAEEIPIKAGTTLAQVKQHQIYMESLTEVEKIEAEYGKTVPGFKLTDYPCNIDPAGVAYDGMTARVLDLSDDKDIALATRLGDLTNCCQCLGSAGETAMMHGFLNPNAGFWVIEDRNGEVKAQAEIWEAEPGVLVFDNIEFADTDNRNASKRAEQLRGIIAAWAMESGYKNIIMGCGFNKLGVGSMEQAPTPELRLTPEEVFALQKGNDANVSFEDVNEARRYMQTEKYRPNDFVYTDADGKCVYIKKDGVVSDYLMKGYDCALTGRHLQPGHRAVQEQDDEFTCK